MHQNLFQARIQPFFLFSFVRPFLFTVGSTVCCVISKGREGVGRRKRKQNIGLLENKNNNKKIFSEPMFLYNIPVFINSHFSGPGWNLRIFYKFTLVLSMGKQINKAVQKHRFQIQGWWITIAGCTCQ